MTARRSLAARALSLIPGADAADHDLLLTALGAGAAFAVIASGLEHLIRLAGAPRPWSTGDAFAAAAGVSVVFLVRSGYRVAAWVALVHSLYLAGTFVAAVLTYAWIGRRGLADPLAQAGPAFAALATAVVMGGLLGGALRLAVPRPSTGSGPLLLRAVGVAILAGTVVHLVWPTSLLLAVAGVSRPNDIRAVLLGLPELLAGPIAGGIYAGRGGASYLGSLALGGLLAIPSALAQVLAQRAQPIDPSLRRAEAVLLLLLALRVAAWPLAAAFARGFLTPPARAPSVDGDT